ncbi:MAG: CocE/NonD family hydrolase C-terminal non-catalytic domain-containing protein, partial [Halobacteria archaeon]|nr:CocE/NonD family hydrolase C-terminal non-catalytic domain-containing protein [Halobacteria archaeon]
IDKHVKGADVPDVPEVSLFDMQNSKWQTYSQYPPSGVSQVDLNLGEFADGDTSKVRKAESRSADKVAQFDIPVNSNVKVTGTPKLQLDVDPKGEESILYFNLYDKGVFEGISINDQTFAYRVRGGERRTIELELTAMMHEIESGRTLRLEIDARDIGYMDSRVSEGTVIHHSGSKLMLPLEKGSAEDLQPSGGLFDLF